MQLTLKVNQGEGKYEVTTNLYVIVAWERRFKRKASNIADAGIGIEDLAFMAYEASKIAGIVIPGELDTFIKRLTVLEVVDQDDALPMKAATD